MKKIKRIISSELELREVVDAMACPKASYLNVDLTVTLYSLTIIHALDDSCRHHDMTFYVWLMYCQIPMLSKLL